MAIYDKPIMIQRLNVDTEEWCDFIKCHASVNKNLGDVNLTGGTLAYKHKLVFKIPYTSKISDVAYNVQLYRIVYRDKPYRIIDYDDYMEGHREVKLTGEFYE
ncbi:MAG: head-tail adaptor protein [Acutalibacteraceae bacterium]